MVDAQKTVKRRLCESRRKEQVWWFDLSPSGTPLHARPQVDSQRLLLWATKQGKAEELMSEFNVRHFERRESVNVRANLLAAAAAAGLDPEATAAFLDTDDLKEEVSCHKDQVVGLNFLGAGASATGVVEREREGQFKPKAL